MKQHLTWSQTQYPINWSSNPYLWSDVSIVIEAVESTGAGSGGFSKWQKENTDKKKTLIKLLCTIDGEKYKEEKYKSEDIELSISDITLLHDKILVPLKINVDFNLSDNENKS